MSTRFALAVAALGLSLPVSLLSGQQPAPDLRPWQKVRVTAPAAAFERSLQVLRAVRGDSMVFVRVTKRPVSVGVWVADTLEFSLPRDAVTRLEVRRSIWGGGEILGLLAGAAIGVAVGGGRCPSHGTLATLDRDLRDCLLILPASALVGGLVGFIVGHGIARTPAWEDLPLSRLRLDLAPPRAGRLGLGAAFSF